jgi:alpha-tubulin suppressor-like RCC1 family protein
VISAKNGSFYTMALKSDGTVWTWGDNTSGQLGDGTLTTRINPIRVSALTGITAIDAGGYHTVALKSDGAVWMWGNNASGELFDGTTTSRYSPVQSFFP